ncbi:MAG TPA: PIG-L family deacetylase, partial [Gemmatimonadales bacterium]|nr:PIG-L family deacetylase [Gemmatimonadales bacterium]
MWRAFGTSFALVIGAAGSAAGQYTPSGTGGVAALAGALQQLGANKRILMIGAHPDDEYSDLVALFARGLGAQVAYLSLSRGEGGQNLIGPELGPELGVIRSEELLAARRIDGARQFFARAYDFGYSKSIDEAWRFWPRDSLLRDVLDVVRRFRPQIIVAVFSGTPRDGHGQHQVSGVLARQAFEMLRDSSWGPVKLYRSLYFDTASATLRLDAGALDPVGGLSYHQIAMAGRSQHRSQDEGQLERPGPSIARLALIEWRDRKRGTSDDGGIFAGVDTLLPGKARYAALIDSARALLNPTRPGAIVPLLARALRELGDADSGQQATLSEALAGAAGVAVDGVADDGIVIPSERLQVEATVWNAGPAAVMLDEIAVTAPPGWKVERLDATTSPVAPGSVATRRFAVTVAPDAARSQPYFLRRPLAGALYDWSGTPPSWRGLPFEPPPVELTVRLTIAGQALTLSREVVYRYR